MSRTRIEDNAFGDWLRQVIHESGISRSEAALGIGVTRASIDAWIGGHRRISEANVREVAEFFGTPHNVVRELAGFEPISRTAPGIIGMRGATGLRGATSVVFVPIIGLTPNATRQTAELGGVMPFAAEYLARFTEPGIIMVEDDSLVHRGIHKGEALVIEQDIQVGDIQPGNLVVVEHEPGVHEVMTWYVDEGGGVTLVPASGRGAPRSFDPETEATGLAGLVRNIYSIRGVE